MGAERGLIFLDRQFVAGEKIGLDTAPLIYYLNRQEPYFDVCLELLKRVESGKLRAVVSVVTEMELLATETVQADRRSINDVEQLLRRLDNLQVLDVDRTVARRAATLRAHTRIKGLDALIVATAITQGCRCVIGNDAEVSRRVTELDYLTLDQILDSTR